MLIGAGQIADKLGTVGLQHDGLPTVGDGLFILSQFHQGDAQTIIGIGIVGEEFDDTLVALGRFGIAMRLKVDGAQRVVSNDAG